MTRSIHAMPFGAQCLDGKRTRFRLWAPAAQRVDLCLGADPSLRKAAMRRIDDGWYELEAEAGAGSRYRYLIDGATLVPDPASRFQPADVQGPSEVVDPLSYDWRDDGWRGRPWQEAVTYELHVGAFTPAGSFAAIAGKFDHLIDLGVTAIELMPLAEVPGRRNWGYDGVLPFAPESAYGTPQSLKAMIDAAHGRGLMVFLDVVYNHFGPEGNYLHLYAPQFFTERHGTPWGAAINFDGGVRPVREFFIHNALYWLEEYHLDGLRLDAVHSIFDESQPDILTELAEAVRASVPAGREVHMMLENDNNEPRYLERRDDRPRWYTAQWNDDMHHALHVIATGETGGYYADYRDDPVHHLGRTLTEGFAYQGEESEHRGGACRGAPSGHLPPAAFLPFLQNHDQVGNRALGERITQLADPAAVRAVLGILLVAPSPPLLFMGEEWGAKQPFPFFCDFHDELAQKVRDGRRREFARFVAFQDPALRAKIPDPNALATFAEAVLDWSAREGGDGRAWLDFYRGLLRVRRAEIVPRLPLISGPAGAFRRHGERGLSVSWCVPGRFDLTAYANLGATPLDVSPIAPTGRLIATVGEGMPEGILRGSWPAWSLAWFLDDGEAP